MVEEKNKQSVDEIGKHINNLERKMRVKKVNRMKSVEIEKKHNVNRKSFQVVTEELKRIFES